MALTRTEDITQDGFTDAKALRSGLEEIGNILETDLPETFGRTATLSAGGDAASAGHIRQAWKELDEAGLKTESGTISVLVGPRDGGYDIQVFLVFDVASLQTSGHVEGFDRTKVIKLASDIRAILKRHAL